MGSPFNRFIRKKQIMLCRFSIILIVSYFGHRIRYLCSDLPPSLETPSLVESATQILPLIKHTCLQQNAGTSMAASEAGNDFGNITQYDEPLAVLSPSSTSDISCILRFINEARSLPLTVAARGTGHSLQGQAQAPKGVVIAMVSLRTMLIQVHAGEQPYVDVHGGHLWIDVLNETLKYGLTPRSWTDYLHLTIGGTLSAAGVSGQAFWHGPQISNVHQMEVVTGKGEVFDCSENQNADLFYAVLGGLGQFGIITRARIPLQAAPKMVKWIRASYSDFSTFSKDQEQLISLSPKKAFEYVEGFVKINASENSCKYVLEVVKYINQEDTDQTKQIVDGFLSKLSYIPSTLAIKEVKYVEFLDRVHASEVKLEAQGRWKVPHPWLNLLVPRSKIQAFAEGVFGNIVQDSSSGPIIIYPVNKTKWSNRTSVVAPDEDVFYKVSFLFSAVTHPTGEEVIERLLNQNKRILKFCEAATLGVKQYMPHYTTRSEWEAHFGPHWEVFRRRKLTYDPLAILAPGQLIFPRKATLMSYV